MALSKNFDFVDLLLGSIRDDLGVVTPLDEEYKITIAPLLLKEDDSPERFFNHLWYTIIDQRRDVRNIVIPIMASLMIAGFNVNFVLKKPEESAEILANILSAYGHELKVPRRDVDRLVEDGFHTKAVPSRPQAIVDTIYKLCERFKISEIKDLEAFRKDIIQNRANYLRNGKLRGEFVKGLPLIGPKSFYFFLRDIEPLADPRAVPIPIDTNVAQSIQKTGLMFDSWPPELSQVIPVANRGKYARVFEDRIRYLVSETNPHAKNWKMTYSERIVRLSEMLFLLGAVYCQKCPSKGKKKLHINDKCPFKERCMLALNVKGDWIKKMLQRLNEK